MTTSTTSSESYTPAPLWRRLAAMVYDSFLILAISMAYGAVTLLISSLLFGTRGEKDYTPTIEGLGFQLGWLLTIGCFYAYFWHKAGQTAGMKAWRLKVMTQDNQSPSFGTGILRFFCALVSLATFGLGYFWSLFDPDKHTLHDKLSKTQTVVTPKLK